MVVAWVGRGFQRWSRMKVLGLLETYREREDAGAAAGARGAEDAEDLTIAWVWQRCGLASSRKERPTQTRDHTSCKFVSAMYHKHI